MIDVTFIAQAAENTAKASARPEPKGIMIDIARWILHLLGADQASEIVATLVMIVVSVAISVSLIWISRKILEGPIKSLIDKSRAKWDDAIFSFKVRQRLAMLPSVFSMSAFGFAMNYDNWLHTLYMKACFLYMSLAVSRFLVAMMNGVFEHLSEIYPRARALNSLRQLVSYVIYIMMGIAMISVILDKDPSALIAGLGASAAVMSLVFKETIQSLVSGIQLSANNMLEPGDWVVVSKAGANGIVTEVNLNTVKIRNWDNTITTVPPSTLLSDSFTNWKGMKAAPGRRFTRSININMDAVRFISTEEEALYYTWPELNLFFERRKKENNGFVTRLTNLALYREYIYAYLARSPLFVKPEEKGRNSDIQLMVRYLPATQYGLPLEVYAFTRTKDWVVYEGVISEVVDFMIASLPLFGLKAYQVASVSGKKGPQNDAPTSPLEHHASPEITSADAPKQLNE